MIDCLRSFCLVKSRGFAHLAALGSVSVNHQNLMLRCVIVNTIGLADLIEMRKTDCFRKARLVPQVPSSS